MLMYHKSFQDQVCQDNLSGMVGVGNHLSDKLTKSQAEVPLEWRRDKI